MFWCRKDWDKKRKLLCCTAITQLYLFHSMSIASILPTSLILIPQVLFPFYLSLCPLVIKNYIQILIFIVSYFLSAIILFSSYTIPLYSVIFCTISYWFPFTFNYSNQNIRLYSNWFRYWTKKYFNCFTIICRLFPPQFTENIIYL